MSFLKSLFGFGRSSSAESSAEKLGEPVEYKGFVIRAAPFESAGQYQTAGLIEKEIDGVRRQHRFIRADRLASFDDAVAFTHQKARQIVDQLGERMFDLPS
jgi:hypothetical protein